MSRRWRLRPRASTPARYIQEERRLWNKARRVLRSNGQAFFTAWLEDYECRAERRLQRKRERAAAGWTSKHWGADPTLPLYELPSARVAASPLHTPYTPDPRERLHDAQFSDAYVRVRVHGGHGEIHCVYCSRVWRLAPVLSTRYAQPARARAADQAWERRRRDRALALSRGRQAYRRPRRERDDFAEKPPLWLARRRLYETALVHEFSS